MKNKKTLSVVVVSVLLVMVFAFVGCSLKVDKVEESTSNSLGKYEIDVEDLENPSIAEIVANNCLEAVCIVTSSGSSNSPFDRTAALGSGFFINEDGYLVTNSHVVEGYTNFSITLAVRNEKGEAIMSSPKQARLIARSKPLDLAVLKVTVDYKVPYLKFAPDDNVLRYGQTVFTIGNPNGLYFSMSHGLISNPAYDLGSDAPYKHIVLDSNINHGNSGGALLNTKSQVIGVIDARIEKAPVSSEGVYGIGLAIPNDSVKKFLTDKGIKYYIDEE